MEPSLLVDPFDVAFPFRWKLKSDFVSVVFPPNAGLVNFLSMSRSLPKLSP